MQPYGEVVPGGVPTPRPLTSMIFLWRATNWPSISPLMACVIQVALDSEQYVLESALDSSNFDPEEWLVLDKFDSRVLMK
jgi:hypothetical protein